MSGSYPQTAISNPPNTDDATDWPRANNRICHWEGQCFNATAAAIPFMCDVVHIEANILLPSPHDEERDH